MKENIFVTLLVVALLLIGVGEFRKDTIVVKPNVIVEVPASTGAASGPDHFNRQVFHAGFQSGGTVYSTSTTASTYTLTNTELGGDISYIEFNTGLLAQTFTTMASTSPVFDAILGHTAGDKRVYDVYMASTTATSVLTWAAGTGVDLQEDEGETVLQNGLEFARVTFIRKVNTDIGMEVEVFQVGD